VEGGEEGKGKRCYLIIIIIIIIIIILATVWSSKCE
jgi:flagellar basal body-associated protein FliL